MALKVLPTYTQEHIAISFVMGIVAGIFITQIVIPVAIAVVGVFL